MNHTEILTRYVANFVDELVRNGVTDVVISPGSRSTPLAMTVCEHKGLNEWVMIDERSAAFFALGMAKETKRPVALLCTSGTAAANYFPAIIEAYYSRVPLLVFTADRPHELRDVGAPQAIEQIKMYGEYVKWFQEMALPEASERMLSYVRGKASRAVFEAGEGNSGPVHLNFPFREPLVPDFTINNLWGHQNDRAAHCPTFNGKKRLSNVQIDHLVNRIINKRRGVIVCGPQIDEGLAQAITKIATKLGLPILADPLSQLRSGKHNHSHIIESYDAIFRNQTIREQLKPEYIIRFGAMPVSKSYLFYIEENKEVLQFIVENDEGFRDPTGNAAEFIYADPILLCQDLIQTSIHINQDNKWLHRWQQMNQIAKKHLLEKTSHELTEGEAVKSLLEVIPAKSNLYVGNSMAVRDLDTFFMTTEKEIVILANRGTSGIDGMVSSALGAAATSKHSLTLLIGDLSFYHDLNGLLAAKHYDLNITILLINNNGGGIFSFLPQANDEKHFETLFGTPIDIDFGPIVSVYDGEYSVPTTKKDLEEQLLQSYQHKGISVIEVQTNRTENAKWHRQKWQDIEQELLQTEW